MILTILGMILGAAISLLWIFLPLRRVPEDIRLKKSVYIRSIIVGAVLGVLIIMILDEIWDRATGILPDTVANLGQAASISYIRAALIEEGTKFLLVWLVLRKRKPQGRLQYMLLAGTIGIGYEIAEKLVMGSALIVLATSVFCMHTMFQFIMGRFLYEAADTEDAGKKKKAYALSFLVPFVLHGTWDFIQFGAQLYTSNDFTFASAASVVLMAAAVVGAVIGEVKMGKYLARV